MISDWLSYERMDSLYNQARPVSIDSDSKFVIFSDLHVGNRRSRDDFRINSEMFMEILKKKYYPQGFTLILNGDVEELLRVPLNRIQGKWPDLYNTFELFHKEGRLIKTYGNHDIDLSIQKNTGINGDIVEAVKLEYEKDSILVFHGHQASPYRGWVNILIGILLKFIAHPLWIKNFSLSHDNTRIHRTERRVYEYAKKKKIIAIIGHTHRPIFESLSEIDFLRYKIEYLLREYPNIIEQDKKKIEDLINKYKRGILALKEEENAFGKRSSLYNQEMIIPTIFNSGCVIGKRGSTGIEIENGMISLVHWYDRRKGKKYAPYGDSFPRPLAGTTYNKMVLKKDFLEYIFTRIRLLS